ncbi:Uncharacterised protein [Mycobacteroides abscessus subsp. abscessus]|nr:Uncharacterised protein [Mycobacteroides abscessus subsp. abscessus]
MTKVALYDVERDTVVEQFGGPGVAQAVGLGEAQWSAGAVGEVVAVVELGQRCAVGVVGAGLLAAVLILHAEEQVSGCQVGVCRLQPALLLGDDVDDGLLHEDGGDDVIDFGLLVAQPGHERVRVAVGGAFLTRDGLQRIMVEHQDF